MAFGVGTALFKKDCTQSVQQALNAGFQFLDTAEAYQNSQFISPVLSSNSSKEPIIVLDKINNMKDIYNVAHEEIKKLAIPKLDALLLHSPPRGYEGKPSNVEAWKVMEKLKDEGLVEWVNSSSEYRVGGIDETDHPVFMQRHWCVQLASKWYHWSGGKQAKAPYRDQSDWIRKFFTSALSWPASDILNFLQHPLIASSPKYQKLLQVQKQESIAVMTYASLAPITKSSDDSTALHNILKEIAKKENDWTPSTVLQKWASQHARTHCDAIIASTTNKPDRLKEYLATFTTRKLTDDEVEQITKAGSNEPQAKYYMIPAFEGRPE